MNFIKNFRYLLLIFVFAAVIVTWRYFSIGASRPSDLTIHPVLTEKSPEPLVLPTLPKSLPENKSAAPADRSATLPLGSRAMSPEVPSATPARPQTPTVEELSENARVLSIGMKELEKRQLNFFKSELGLNELEIAQINDIHLDYGKKISTANEQSDNLRSTELFKEQDDELRKLMGTQNFQKYENFRRKQAADIQKSVPFKQGPISPL